MRPSVVCFTNGPWRQNCYLVHHRRDGLIIDPGSDADRISDELDRIKVRPLAILNTHAHFDHIGAVAPLMAQYGIPFYLHSADAPLLRRANLYRLMFDGKTSIKVPDTFEDLEGVETLQIGPFNIQVLVTPGHTLGGVSFLFEDSVFTGDTLMTSGPGRHDLPGGDVELLRHSMTVYESLAEGKTAYAGHGKPFDLKSGLAQISGTTL